MVSENDPVDEEVSDPIRDLARWLAEINIEKDLVRAEQLGPFELSEGRPVFLAAQGLGRTIADLPTESIAGVANENRLRESLDSLKSALQAAANFDPTAVSDPSEQRRTLLAGVETQLRGAREAFILVAGYLNLVASRSGGQNRRLNEAILAATATIDQIQGRVDDRLATSELRLAEAIERAEQSVARAQEAADATQAQAARSGVVQHAEVFKLQADAHAGRATTWLKWGILGIVGLLVFALIVVMALPVGSDLSDPRTVQLILLKGLAITFGGYLVLLAFRMFRAESHLRIVNVHRHLALTTFETFVAGATDPGTKDAVLMEATRSIFSPSATGMLDGPEPGGHPTQLLEVVRQSVTGGANQPGS